MKMTRCASSHHWEGISSRPPRNTPKKIEDPTGSRTSYRKAARYHAKYIAGGMAFTLQRHKRVLFHIGKGHHDSTSCILSHLL